MIDFEAKMRQGGRAALEEASRFFSEDNRLFHTLSEMTARLEKQGIEYAVSDGMALVAQGCYRTTEQLTLLVRPEHLAVSQQTREGLSDTDSRITFVLSGERIGGKSELTYPDPSDVAVQIDGIRYVRLPALLEMKLASGLASPGRMTDLADVQEAIRMLNLPADFDQQLNPLVRHKYRELWQPFANGTSELE